MVGLSVGLGIASGLTSFMGGLSADKAQAAAIARQNAAIKQAADQTRKINKVQNEYMFGQQRANIGSQNKALVGAMAATNAARGITGSRVADTLKSNANQQSFLQLEDLAVSEFLADKEVDLNWANALNQRSGYQGQSTGLMLLGAGLQGLQTGLSAYSTLK